MTFVLFIKNNRGLTLLELLAAIAISSIVITLVVSVLISSFTSYQKTQVHVDLRQEANLIQTLLTEVHQKNAVYTILYNEDNILTINDYQINREDIDVTLKVGIDGFHNLTEIIIDSGFLIRAIDSTIYFELTVTSIHNPSSTFSTQGTINRLVGS